MVDVWFLYRSYIVDIPFMMLIFQRVMFVVFLLLLNYCFLDAYQHGKVGFDAVFFGGG